MIVNSLERERKPRLKKPCSKCGKKFTPKGLSRSEKLCEICFDKARSPKRRKNGNKKD